MTKKLTHFQRFTKAHNELNEMADSFGAVMRMAQDVLQHEDFNIAELVLELGEIDLLKKESILGNKFPIDRDKAKGKCSDDRCVCGGYVNHKKSCLSKRTEWQNLCRREDYVVGQLKRYALIVRGDAYPEAASSNGGE